MRAVALERRSLWLPSSYGVERLTFWKPPPKYWRSSFSSSSDSLREFKFIHALRWTMQRGIASSHHRESDIYLVRRKRIQALLQKLSVNFIKNLHGEGVIFTSLLCLINIYWLHVKWDSFKLERSLLGSIFSLSDWLKPTFLREARVRLAPSISFPSSKMYVLLLIRIWDWKPEGWVSVSSAPWRRSVC